MTKTIGVVGLGYIGLPTAAIIAAQGVNVIGVDVNQHAVDTINQGKIHIVEPDLDALVQEVVRKGNLKAVTRPEPADAFLIAVPTPFKGVHEPDLSYVEAAARSLAPILRKGNLVILESTSPVGATEKMASWLADARPDLNFPDQSGEAADVSIAYCPERVLPGKVLHELVVNDRVVGGLTPDCGEKAAALYRLFVRGNCLITNARTAEMCKLTENAFRDVNIAFANELSLISDELGINVWELIKLANHHPRVNILQPGPGVGGHCIAVDPWFIVDSAPKSAKLIRTAREVNDNKPHYVIGKLESLIREINTSSKILTIACMGLAFKPDIDDLRESPAIEIVEHIAEKGIGTLLIVEPNIDSMPINFSKFQNIKLVDAEAAIQAADIVLMLVNHREFYQIDRALLNGKKIIDTRGVWQ
jgi:UDP-N-acetyl-D-mannosaminuronic acid dehydrogenase